MRNKAYLKYILQAFLGISGAAFLVIILWLGIFYTPDIAVKQITIELQPERLLIPELNPAL